MDNTTHCRGNIDGASVKEDPFHIEAREHFPTIRVNLWAKEMCSFAVSFNA